MGPWTLNDALSTLILSSHSTFNLFRMVLAVLYFPFYLFISIFCFLRRLFYTYQLGQRVSKERDPWTIIPTTSLNGSHKRGKRQNLRLYINICDNVTIILTQHQAFQTSYWVLTTRMEPIQPFSYFLVSRPSNPSTFANPPPPLNE